MADRLVRRLVRRLAQAPPDLPRPGSPGEPAHLPSLIALDNQAFTLRDPHHRAALLDAAAGDGPLAHAAKRKIDDLWRGWLAEPDEVVWRFLSEWGRPPHGLQHHLGLVALGQEVEHRGHLVDAARRYPHPVGRVARQRILADPTPAMTDAVCETVLARGDDELAAFCIDHQLAPSDQVRRAMFLVRTGQADRYRALDPDGSLLTLAYRAATAPERERLRTAMLRAGGMDTVRVLVGTGLDRLGSDEFRYLCARLRVREKWAQLWELAQDLPLAEAVRAVGMCDDGWRPADDRGRALFDRLRAADAAALGAATEELVRTVELEADVTGGAFSRDGRRLAAGMGNELCVVDLASGSVVARQALSGDAIRSARVAPYGRGFWVGTSAGVVRVPEAGNVAIDGLGRCLALAPTSVGAVVLGDQRADQFSYPINTAHHQRRLWYIGGSGRVDRTVSVARWRALATPAAGPWVALGGSAGLAVHDTRRGGGPCHSWTGEGVEMTGCQLTFVDDQLLAATCWDGQLRSWSIMDSGLVPLGTAPVAHPDDGRRPAEVVAVPGRAEVAHLGRWSGVSYWDATTLRPVAGSRPFAGERLASMWGSIGGKLLAAAHGSTVEIVPSLFVGVAAFARQPLANAVPADLDAVIDVLEAPSLTPALAAFLRLLRACLEHRFGSEVGLGASSPRIVDRYGIGLSQPEESE